MCVCVWGGGGGGLSAKVSVYVLVWLLFLVVVVVVLPEMKMISRYNGHSTYSIRHAKKKKSYTLLASVGITVRTI